MAAEAATTERFERVRGGCCGSSLVFKPTGFLPLSVPKKRSRYEREECFSYRMTAY